MTRLEGLIESQLFVCDLVRGLAKNAKKKADKDNLNSHLERLQSIPDSLARYNSKQENPS